MQNLQTMLLIPLSYNTCIEYEHLYGISAKKFIEFASNILLNDYYSS